MASKRARILYVQPNSEVGGSDLALLRLVSSLDQQRYEPIVLLPQDGPLVSRFRDAGIRTLFLPMMQLRTLPSLSYQMRYLAMFWVTVARMRKVIRDERIDLVHTNSLYALYGGFAALFAGRAHVWHIREIPPQLPLARAVLGWLVLRLSRVVISMTQACSLGLFATLAHPKVRLLSEGLDRAVWSRRRELRDIRAELGLGADNIVVGFVARLDPWKGLDVFLEAAAEVAKRYPKTVFLVSGDAPPGFESYRDSMIARAAKLGLGDRIRFLGWRYRMDDIPALMASLDVFCHTSIQPEPFGLVVIEAMAMGCPVIAARDGGPLEILDGGMNGQLTPPGDAAALAAAICDLIAHPERRKSVSEAGLERVRSRYSKEAFRPALDAIYAPILQGSGI